MMKNKFSLKLNQYFLDKVSPDIIIEFIYKNVYELIDEIPFISSDYPKDFNEQLLFSYNFYYKMVIEKSEENYLLTFFPNPELSYYCGFKKMYTGLVGRLFFFSDKLSNYYFYGDSKSWHISNNINNKNGKLHIQSCIFILLSNYSEFQVENSLGDITNPDYGFVICKKKIESLISKNYKVGHYVDKDVQEMLKMYKTNYSINYKPEINKVWETYCRNNFTSKSMNKVGCYKLEIQNRLKNLKDD